MRRRRSELTAVAIIGSLLAGTPSLSRAQARAEGAPELVFPFGARAVGIGQAAVAHDVGSDAIWWNPAGLAALARREVALQYLQRGEIVNVTALSYTMPWSPVGVFGISGSVADYGSTPATDRDGVETGRVTPRFPTALFSFATSFPGRVFAGVNYKIFQRRFDCTGFCPENAENSAVSSAVDLGFQHRISDSLPLTLGVAVRNLGLRLQQRDEAQADVIPTRYHVGASYAPRLGPAMANLAARVSAELVRSPNFSETGTRVGGELAYEGRFFVRAGYASKAGSSGGGIGLGLISGRLQVDLARSLGSEQEVLGAPPTLLTLRFLF